MIVTSKNFQKVMVDISECNEIVIDTETTGLRPYHDSRLFSIIIGTPNGTYYFNFQKYTELSEDYVFGDSALNALKIHVFNVEEKIIIGHNIKFDIAILKAAGIDKIEGTIYDTGIGARLLHNDYFNYSLDACGDRIGFKKDDAVKKWLDKNKGYENVLIPGKKTKSKDYHFEQTPFNIIAPYGTRDVDVTRAVYRHQQIEIPKEKEAPALEPLLKKEMDLLRVVQEMENYGLLIDPDYCKRAIEIEEKRIGSNIKAFEKETGKEFKDSGKLFQELFLDEKDKWGETKTGLPSFNSEALESFKNPLAHKILEYRDGKSRSNFFNGFLYFADKDNIIHPGLKQDGTATGRFASSNPNFQNLTADDKSIYPVRGAIVPREDYVFISPDYSGMEYSVLLDIACQVYGRLSPLADKVNQGFDVHQTMADLVGGITRSEAKTVNFSIIFGSGIKALAAGLGVSETRAREIKTGVFDAAPEIGALLSQVTAKAKSKGKITNWAGRRYYFPDANFAYKALNYLIQGSSADVMKRAMLGVHKYLDDKKSNMLLVVHDEILIEVHKSEIEEVPKNIQKLMEAAYPAKYVGLKVEMAWSDKSFSSMQDGYPC